MEIIKIIGPNVLEGSVDIVGAKNSALPSIVAACLTDKKTVLTNVPTKLNDVKVLIKIMEEAGAVINIINDFTVECDGSNWRGGSLNETLSGSLRHSLLLLGLSASKNKSVYLPLPGGCDLGSRKHDMHLDGFRSLGYNIYEDNGIFLDSKHKNTIKTNVHFYYPTFGGTLNIIFATVKGAGTLTRIVNAARNPEVQDVIDLLNQSGAQITWENDQTLHIKGVKYLSGITKAVISDRIVAATVIAATAITKGHVIIKNFDKKLLASEVDVWEKSGLNINQIYNDLEIKYKEQLVATEIETSPYPGFHTDIQPLHVAMMMFANNNSIVKETILDGRFRYCTELLKMGAKIEIIEGDFKCVNGAQGQIAYIEGNTKLHGTRVFATDIRGSASVAISAMAAQGITYIYNIYQLERGYHNFVDLFNSLGVNISKVNVKENILKEN